MTFAVCFLIQPMTTSTGLALSYGLGPQISVAHILQVLSLFFSSSTCGLLSLEDTAINYIKECGLLYVMWISLYFTKDKLKVILYIAC